MQGMAAPLSSPKLSGVNLAIPLDTACVCSLCLHRRCPPAQGRAPHQLWPLDPRPHHGLGPPAPSKRSRGLFESCLARPHSLPRHPHLQQHPHCLRPGTQGPLQLSLAVSKPRSYAVCFLGVGAGFPAASRCSQLRLRSAARPSGLWIHRRGAPASMSRLGPI